MFRLVCWAAFEPWGSQGRTTASFRRASRPPSCSPSWRRCAAPTSGPCRRTPRWWGAMRRKPQGSAGPCLRTAPSASRAYSSCTHLYVCWLFYAILIHSMLLHSCYLLLHPIGFVSTYIATYKHVLAPKWPLEASKRSKRTPGWISAASAATMCMWTARGAGLPRPSATPAPWKTSIYSCFYRKTYHNISIYWIYEHIWAF